MLSQLKKTCIYNSQSGFHLGCSSRGGKHDNIAKLKESEDYSTLREEIYIVRVNVPPREFITSDTVSGGF